MMAMWDGIVGNAAQALAHPALTSAVRSLHPDVMPPAGGIAAYANSGSMQPGRALQPSWNDPVGGAPTTWNMPPAWSNHPGANLSGSAPFMGSGQGQPAGSVPGGASPAGGIAVYADGGPVASGQPDASGGAPSGGLPDPTDPRMSAIADAEDALGSVEAGQPLQPEHVQALQSFTNAFGPTALAHLHANVKQGLTMRPRKARLVVGAGSGKSDGIPARVNNVQEAKLSNGEFVMPAEAVHGAGNGDPALGAQRLQQLSAQLASMKPAGAVKAASLTSQASAVQPAGGPPINVDNVRQ